MIIIKTNRAYEATFELQLLRNGTVMTLHNSLTSVNALLKSKFYQNVFTVVQTHGIELSRLIT